ncbi:F0F1 ATP synthase subunit gamma [Mycoplasmopsis felis]|uniref:F0F1 ATP synthase subunit gamma n=1 Tax=Mycoplasmopsis felis TaxID=33923 RepID=UPI003A5C8370
MREYRDKVISWATHEEDGIAVFSRIHHNGNISNEDYQIIEKALIKIVYEIVATIPNYDKRLYKPLPKKYLENPNLNNLKNRISVVSNTQKITNAMELVSTSKLRRLRNEYTQVKSYLDTLQDTFNELIAHTCNQMIFMTFFHKIILKVHYILL